MDMVVGVSTNVERRPYIPVIEPIIFVENFLLRHRFDVCGWCFPVAFAWFAYRSVDFAASLLEGARLIVHWGHPEWMARFSLSSINLSGDGQNHSRLIRDILSVRCDSAPTVA